VKTVSGENKPRKLPTRTIKFKQSSKAMPEVFGVVGVALLRHPERRRGHARSIVGQGSLCDDKSCERNCQDHTKEKPHQCNVVGRRVGTVCSGTPARLLGSRSGQSGPLPALPLVETRSALEIMSKVVAAAAVVVQNKPLS